MSTHLVIPDPHAHPDHNNDRAEWLGKLIKDLKPDVVINMGDVADFPSLSGYDKGKRSFYGKSYRDDVNAALDFEEKMWGPVRRSKKKLPYRVVLEGNHEHRIERALDLNPELKDTLTLKDLEWDRYYDYQCLYEGGTPGIVTIDSVNYAHFFVSGVMGRPIGGEHPAYSLITKQYQSCTAGHLHCLDWANRTTARGEKIYGLVSGVFQDYDSSWAGEVNKLWWRGVVIKRGVENGCYDPEFVSLDRLRKEYGQ